MQGAFSFDENSPDSRNGMMNILTTDIVNTGNIRMLPLPDENIISNAQSHLMHIAQ
jgi:hypothetical protein